MMPNILYAVFIYLYLHYPTLLGILHKMGTLGESVRVAV